MKKKKKEYVDAPIQRSIARDPKASIIQKMSTHHRQSFNCHLHGDPAFQNVSHIVTRLQRKIQAQTHMQQIPEMPLAHSFQEILRKI